MSVSVVKLSPEDTLTLRLKINASESGLTTITPVPDEDYTISYTKFKLKVHVQDLGHLVWHTVYFQFRPNNQLRETVKVTSYALLIKNRTFQNNGAWAQVYNSKREKDVFVIDINIQVVKPIFNKNIDLYDDQEMTDVELRVCDGCVRFHRVILALSSPVLKAMLSGQWKESDQGHVEVPGISKNTIEQFKDFIYKSLVPENVSLELLSLASYYMITELEDICVEKIADSLTSENSWKIMEYCASHKLTKLMLVILSRAKHGQIDEKVFV